MLFLDALYRDAAGKAGITYVDVWDGFVDEAGRFLQKGPDFEGQIRQLRSSDGVYFTKPGARKLAHYVEREVTRLLAARSGADRAADRTGDARRQCRARPAGAASAGRTDRAAGGLVRRYRSIARRSRLAPGRGRCAGRANAGQGRSRWRRRPAAPTISPGRAAKSAANRPRATRRSRRHRRSGTVAAAPAQKQLVAAAATAQPQQKRNSVRPRSSRSGRPRTRSLRCATSSAVSAPRRASQRRQPPGRRVRRPHPACRARRVMSDARRKSRRAISRDNADGVREIRAIAASQC